jgi:hypothetical protein
MWRWTAWWLVAIFSGIYAAPLIAVRVSDPDANLPACCRRHGIHHCALMDRSGAVAAGVAVGSERIVAAPGRCPFFPHMLAATHPNLFAAQYDTLAGFSFLLCGVLASCIASALLPTSRDRSHPKRGPPVFAS